MKRRPRLLRTTLCALLSDLLFKERASDHCSYDSYCTTPRCERPPGDER